MDFKTWTIEVPDNVGRADALLATIRELHHAEQMFSALRFLAGECTTRAEFETLVGEAVPAPVIDGAWASPLRPGDRRYDTGMAWSYFYFPRMPTDDGGGPSEVDQPASGQDPVAGRPSDNA